MILGFLLHQYKEESLELIITGNWKEIEAELDIVFMKDYLVSLKEMLMGCDLKNPDLLSNECKYFVNNIRIDVKDA